MSVCSRKYQSVLCLKKLTIEMFGIQTWHRHRAKTGGQPVEKWVNKGVSTQKSAKDEAIYNYNFIIPSFAEKKYLYWNNIVDHEVTTTLSRCRSLNCWEMATDLFAIQIPRDQNSLVNSISVALWGILDGEQHISNLLSNSLKVHSQIWERRFANDKLFSVRELRFTKGSILPHHIFILCNILCRPIIVVCDKSTFPKVKGHDTGCFPGIYLPLMNKPIDCSKSPIFLSYCSNHFSPLVMKASLDKSKPFFEKKYNIVFPLLSHDLCPLPIKFLLESEEIRAGEILQNYLIIKETNCITGDCATSVPFLHSEHKPLPRDKDTVLDYVLRCVQSCDKIIPKDHQIPSSRINLHQLNTGFRSDQYPMVPNETSVVKGEFHSAKTEAFGELNGNVDEVARLEPNAPPMSIDNNANNIRRELYSMTKDRCQSCNSYRSSVETYPFCHECFESQNKMNQSKLSIGISSNGYDNTQIPSLHPQVKDEDRFKISPEIHIDEIYLPSKNEEDFDSSNKLKESLLDDYPCLPPDVRELYEMKGKLVKCASPICNEQIYSPEKLCLRCIKILKVHHETNCNKSCCNDTNFMKKSPVRGLENGAGLTLNSIESNFHKHQDMTPTGMELQADLNRTTAYLNHQMVERYEQTLTVRAPFIERNGSDSKISQQSLLVTTLTSASDNEEKQVLENNLSLFDLEIEENAKEKVKCNNHFCNNLGNEDKYYYCNDCFSMKRKQISQGYHESRAIAVPANRDQFSTHESYDETMQHIESSLQKNAVKCKTQWCSNFGSEYKEGLCNACFGVAVHVKYFPHHQWHHQSNGVDQCDGIHMSSDEEDEID